MWDLTFEIIRALVIGLTFVFLWIIGRKKGLRYQKGWWFIYVGWGLIFTGSLFAITDNFEELNKFVVIGDTAYKAFIEKFICFLFGYILIFYGFIQWIPSSLKRADALRNDFVAMVAHELRTPLTSMHGSLKMIEAGEGGNLSDKGKNIIDIAIKNSERFNLLINDILDLAKIESGKIAFNFSQVPLVPFLQQAIETHRVYGQKHGVTFTFKSDDPTLELYTDPDRLLQVISNLLSNAAKFSPPSEDVEVNLYKKNNVISIAITNKGPAIPQEFHHEIFEKFAQAESQFTNSNEGTGLGLAISKEIIERLGGKIGFVSSDKVGTTFYVDLPVN